jgi:hypothetical protein
MGEGQEAGEESSGLAEAPAFSRHSLFLASAVMIVHRNSAFETTCRFAL